ncbi:MAG TPA: hypothetical protein VFE37_12490 [Chloroflexota bacterium]|nr:hypothetical protein [Chloroflexota bacterium]
MFPVAGGSWDPKAHIARLVAEGKLPRAAVTAAEQLWRERLTAGVLMPNGELAHVELSDLYHLLVDDRIWRKPERIERVLASVFEIREAHSGRRKALSRWTEDAVQLFGYAILEPDSRVRTIHLLDQRGERKHRRKGRVLWRP